MITITEMIRKTSLKVKMGIRTRNLENGENERGLEKEKDREGGEGEDEVEDEHNEDLNLPQT